MPEVREDAVVDPDGAGELRSLREDVEALIDDGKTYLEAELIYQKTRAAFVADRAKDAALFAVLAAAFGVLALIGLTVGLIIALTPLLTAWGASALVVALLLIGAGLSLRAASRRWARLMAAIDTAPRR
jgi:Flp pilus assembly protein TadB